MVVIETYIQNNIYKKLKNPLKERAGVSGPFWTEQQRQKEEQRWVLCMKEQHSPLYWQPGRWNGSSREWRNGRQNLVLKTHVPIRSAIILVIVCPHSSHSGPQELCQAVPTPGWIKYMCPASRRCATLRRVSMQNGLRGAAATEQLVLACCVHSCPRQRGVKAASTRT